ncbi:MAG: DegT/DnrJ/EryC1/StrS family aminotransferase [Bryobacterales bacterium]|nr:DegT/DnrJ/EryC1/StrS family aminotransferase [Bryobacteraceae bacterium]MDW8129480.1 DegT/DnrJ/EryC1/StrS family aminotransferase [Bryobacterales bacterium]
MKEAPAARIPLLDLVAQHRVLREEVLAALLRVVDSQAFILGEEVEALERELAAYCGARFAIGCASGTDALYLALLALGIGPGDEVVTTPYTFFATAGAIVRAGARPVFADVEAATFHLDVERATALVCSRPAVRAVIAVHLFGACADMDPLCEVAARRGVPVIEDAAQAIGAEYKRRRAGSLGAVGCFSFYPSKNLGGYGDGGLLTTNDEVLADRLRALRVHGSREPYRHEWVGINSRLDALQAAVLRVKLRYLDGWTEARERNARYYRRRLAELGLPVVAPQAPPHATRHVWNQFVIRAPERDRLRECLRQKGIGTEVYYPVPLHLQPCFRELGYRPGDFPVSEQLAREALALPVYPELSEEALEQVVQAIASFYRD